MNKPLNDFLNTIQFKQLCTECEDWTDGECSECGLPLCNDCFDLHIDGHYDNDWDQEDGP